jgi:threonine dehydratase
MSEFFSRRAGYSKFMSAMLPTVGDVVEAAVRLREWISFTPALESQVLNERVGRRVLVKAECLQQGGSFKIRGAMNRLLTLSHAERSVGVVAFSSGNHAQAVALAGKWLQVPVTIVMPQDAPRVKQSATRAWGAEIVLYDRYVEDRERIAAGIAEKRGCALVPPFDHAAIIAGQGTAGLELVTSARERGLKLAAVYVPCGGGGLTAGCSLALRAAFPECAVYAVEPQGYDDTARSLASGERQMLETHTDTICDALMAPTPGAITFRINRTLVHKGLTVSDAQVRHAMAFALRHLRIVLEPAGAVALAAVLNAEQGKQEAIGIVASGGNVDVEMVRSVAAEFPEP